MGKAKRLRVHRRDGGVCYLCGKACDRGVDPPHPDAQTIDHVVPRSRGGSDEDENLRVACHRCNAWKGDRLLGELPGK